VEVCEGIILAAYLVEQSFKTALREINPLLIFETAGVTSEKIAKLINGNLSAIELLKLKTIPARKLITLICEFKTELKIGEKNFLELFDVRNAIIHSTDDVPASDNSVETAVSALKTARNLIGICTNIPSNQINPLTSRDFEKLQAERRAARETLIKGKIREHQVIYNQLSRDEIQRKIKENKPREDSMTWIETTVRCPACGEDSFDAITSVDVDVSDGQTTMDAGSSWFCRVCGLDLTDYETDLAYTALNFPADQQHEHSQ